MFYTFLTTPNEVEKHAEVVDKRETKIVIHTSTLDDYGCYYNINILNLVHLESQWISNKSVVKNKLNDSLDELKISQTQTNLILKSI